MPANDKLMHFFVGWVIIHGAAGIGVATAFLRAGDMATACIIGTGAGILAAAAKEYRDGMGYGQKELADYLFTILPAAPLMVILVLLQA